MRRARFPFDRFVDDTLVAEVVSGEDADVEWNGGTFQISTLCSDDGMSCPSETCWRDVAVDQPWGNGNKLLDFVNLDLERAWVTTTCRA